MASATFVLLLIATAAFAEPSTTPAAAGCADDYHQCLPAWRWRDAAGGFTSDYGIFDVGTAAFSSLPRFFYSVANMLWGVTLWLVKEASSLDVAGLAGIGEMVNNGFVGVAETVSGYVAPLVLFTGLILVTARQIKGGKSAKGWQQVVRPLFCFGLLFSMLAWTSSDIAAPGENGAESTQVTSVHENQSGRLVNEFGRQVPAGSPAWLLSQAFRLSDGVTDNVASSVLNSSLFDPEPVNDWNRLDCAYYVESLHYAAMTHDNLSEAQLDIDRKLREEDFGSAESFRDAQLTRINASTASMLSMMWERAYLRSYVRTQFDDATAGWRSYCWVLEDRSSTSPAIQRAVIAANGGPDAFTTGDDINEFIDELDNLAGVLTTGSGSNAGSRARWAAHGVCGWSKKKVSDKEWDLGAYYGLTSTKSDPFAGADGSDNDAQVPGTGGYYMVMPDAQYVHVGATEAFYGDDASILQNGVGLLMEAAPDMFGYGEDQGLMGGVIGRATAPGTPSEWAEWCSKWWQSGSFRHAGSPLTFMSQSEWVAATRNLNDLVFIIETIYGALAAVTDSTVNAACGIGQSAINPALGAAAALSGGSICNTVFTSVKNFVTGADHESLGDEFKERSDEAIAELLSYHAENPTAAQGFTYAQYDSRSYFAGLAGHGINEGTGASVLALIVSVIYLLAFGGMSLGLIVAQIGVVLFFIIVPLFLLMGMWPGEKMGERVGKGVKFGIGMVFARTMLALLMGVFTLITATTSALIDGWRGSGAGTVTDPFTTASPLAVVNVPGDGMGDAMVAALPPLITYFLLKWAFKEAGFGNPFSLKGAMGMVGNAARYATDNSSHRPGRMTSMARTYMNPLSMYGPMSMRRWGKKAMNAANSAGDGNGPPNKRDKPRPSAASTRPRRGGGDEAEVSAAGVVRGGDRVVDRNRSSSADGEKAMRERKSKQAEAQRAAGQEDGQSSPGGLFGRAQQLVDGIDQRSRDRTDRNPGWAGRQIIGARRLSESMKNSDSWGLRFLHRQGGRALKIGGATALFAAGTTAGPVGMAAAFAGYKGAKNYMGGYGSSDELASSTLGMPQSETVPDVGPQPDEHPLDAVDRMAETSDGPRSGAPSIDVQMDTTEWESPAGGSGAAPVPPPPPDAPGPGGGTPPLPPPGSAGAGVEPDDLSEMRRLAAQAEQAAVASHAGATHASVAASRAGGAAARSDHGASRADQGASRAGEHAGDADSSSSAARRSNAQTREVVQDGLRDTRRAGEKLRDGAVDGVRRVTDDAARRQRTENNKLRNDVNRKDDR